MHTLHAPEESWVQEPGYPTFAQCPSDYCTAETRRHLSANVMHVATLEYMIIIIRREHLLFIKILTSRLILIKKRFNRATIYAQPHA